MRQFKIRDDGFKEIRKATLIRTIPLMVLAMGTGVTIALINLRKQHTDVNVVLFLIPFMVLLLIFTMYRAVKRQKQLSESYRLIISDNAITRESYNTPRITIPLENLNSIVKNVDGSFVIKGNSTYDIINVPSQITDYEDLEKTLSEIKPISTMTNQPFLHKFRGLVSIFTLGMMSAVYLSKDKVIVGVCGTILLIALSYSFVQLHKNKNIDNKTRKGFLFVFIVILSIIGVMYLKLTGKTIS